MTEVEFSQREKRLTMSVLVTPDKVNFTGNVHGGEMMKMLDEVAYACVSRCSGNYVVTQSVDQVVFKRPVRIGESVTSLATVNFAGRTSLEVGVKVNSENIQKRSCRHTNLMLFHNRRDQRRRAAGTGLSGQFRRSSSPRRRENAS
jgi:acyl-CoA hydrolase